MSMVKDLKDPGSVLVFSGWGPYSVLFTALFFFTVLLQTVHYILHNLVNLSDKSGGEMEGINKMVR